MLHIQHVHTELNFLSKSCFSNKIPIFSGSSTTISPVTKARETQLLAWQTKPTCPPDRIPRSSPSLSVSDDPPALIKQNFLQFYQHDMSHFCAFMYGLF